MKSWQNPHALKRVKTEVEACALQLSGALEAVIATPVDDVKDLAPLQDAVKDFVRVPGTLRMLEFTHLALLAGEIQAVLLDTLRAEVELDSRELDLRLESSFVAVTDLPALLECALRRGNDSYELVFKLVNRLRKARGCAIIFAGAALLKNEDVSFRKQFAQQGGEKMRAVLAKQTEGLQKASNALAKNPLDPKALQILATVLENFELVLRDHKGGVLWGLARALVEVYEAGPSDRATFVACFQGLVPQAQKLLADSGQLEAGIEEDLLERMVNLIGGASVDTGRPGIARLWYNLNLGRGKAFRADYRDIQVNYYKKGALTKCLTLLGEDCKRTLESINELAEAATVSRDKTREVYQTILKLRDVLRMLGLDYLSDLIDARLPAAPGEKLDEALTLAASLLFRINKEVECKLEKMEREVFSNDAALAVEEGTYASRARVLLNAIQTLDSVMVALDEHVADADTTHLRRAHDKLDMLANVLATVQLAQEVPPFTVARDYLAWLLAQPAAWPNAEQHWMLAQVLVGSMRTLEQLVYGRDATPGGHLDAAAALRAHLDAQQAAAQPNTRKLALISAVTTARAPEMAAVNDAVAEEQIEPAAEIVDESLLAVFLEEAEELLQNLDTLYLNWRKAPLDKTCVGEYLRVLHTIKGSAALVCEHELSKLAHEYETFIVDARQRKRDFDADFFAACDTRLHGLHDVYRLYRRDEAGHLVKSVPPPAAAAIPAAPPVELAAPAPVVDVTQETPAIAAPVEPVTEAAAIPVAHALPQPQPLPVAVHEEAPAPDEQIRVSSKLLKSLLNDADEITLARSRVETSVQEIAALLLDMDVTLARFRACVNALDHQAGKPPARLESRNSAARGNEEFDALEMDRYTELQELAVALGENHNDLQDMRANLGTRVKDIGHMLDSQQRLNNSLQDGLILTQMVPFASVVPRLSRLVRQIGVQLDKQVRLDVENQQGSLDRNILQAIITPLEHIVRNAIDHGIEPGETRRQRGKPAEATLRITVARRGASFRIEIRDDGQGIDVERVRQQAVRNGLLKADAAITEQEAYGLLFQSGFSTAATVSSISGRGVGLDVVKSEITEIGGTVEVESVHGAGAAFILNLPLTSSLNRALIFAVQEARYAVLMNTLDGVLVEKLASVHQKQQQGKPVFDYGGKRYEYLYLGKLLDDSFKPRLDSIDSPISLLLVGGAMGNYALHIDAIVESRDLVVKSLGQQFVSMPGIAGGVILPDGHVAIVLDLKAMLGAQGKDRQGLDTPLTLAPKKASDRLRKLVMVVDDSVTVRKATSDMLKRNGMDVITARNGLEAIELLESSVPDLILLDIEMPRMDGFEVASWVRAQAPPVCDIPVIMITSRIGEKHRSRAEAIGVNEYLCKPFKEDSLLQSISGY
jgi:chemotaxis protein histidine kinase CheA